MPVSEVWNVKRSKHLLVFFGTAVDGTLAMEFLSWLNARVGSPHANTALAAQAEFYRRRQSESLNALALIEKHGVNHLLASNPSVQVGRFGLLEFPVGPVKLAVDVFRPRSDLHLEHEADDCGLEVVVTAVEHPGSGPDVLSGMAADLVRAFHPAGLVGAGGMYLSRFVLGWREVGPIPRLREYLWPLTYPVVPVAEQVAIAVGAATSTLPGGLAVQVFADLDNGQQSAYDRVVAASGLRSFADFPFS
jgi:hypothetical protein